MCNIKINQNKAKEMNSNKTNPRIFLGYRELRIDSCREPPGDEWLELITELKQ